MDLAAGSDGLCCAGTGPQARRSPRRRCCRLQAHMATRPGSPEQVYATQMLRPLVAAIDAALAQHAEEVALLAKTQAATAARAQAQAR